jgi:hypothetical protein
MSELAQIEDVAINNTAGEFALSANTQAVLHFALENLEYFKYWRDYPDEQFSQVEIDRIQELVDNATYEVMTPIVITPQVYVNEFLVLGHQFTKVVGGDLSPVHLATQDYGFYLEQNPVAILNEIKCEVLIAAGNWNFKYICSLDSVSGIVTSKIDGAYEQTQDLYSAAVVLNSRPQFGTAIGLGAGLHTFNFKVNSKRAASTGYRMRITGVYGRNNGTLI